MSPNAYLQKASPQFWILACFLLVVFMTGGASRTDEQSLIVLGPASCLVIGLALPTLDRAQLKQNRGLLAGFAAIFVLALLYILPLPVGTYPQGTVGEIATKVRAQVADHDSWSTLSFAPAKGWAALNALLAPLAVMLLAIQLDRKEIRRVLPILLALGTLSGFLGLLQILGDRDGPLYLYRITNNGAAVGFFANRNHSAVLLACLFPMVATIVLTGEQVGKQRDFRKLLAVALIFFLVPLILVTGSRSGMLLSVLALASSALIYFGYKRANVSPAKFGTDQNKRNIIGGVGAVALVAALTFYVSRAESLNRLFGGGEMGGEDSRNIFWRNSLALARQNPLWGTGPGTFADAYRVVEPASELGASYVNRAHNDVIETAVTFGAPSLLLVAVFVLLYLRRTIHIWSKAEGNGPSQGIIFAKMASVAIAIIALASLVDYPLRTPIMMCVMAVLVLWFNQSGRRHDPKDRSTLS